MSRRIPRKQIIFLLKGFDLLVKQMMVRRQSGKKDQCLPGQDNIINPVMNRTGSRFKGLFCHRCPPCGSTADKLVSSLPILLY